MMLFFPSLLRDIVRQVIPTAHAHVEYVVDPAATNTHKGQDWSFLLSAVQDVHHIGLMIGAVLIVTAIGWLCYRTGWSRAWSQRISQRAASYEVFIPWIVRLSLGILLIGSGTHQHWISPILQGPAWLGTVQIALGFLVLLGVGIVPIGISVIALYVAGLTQEWYLIGNMEVLGLAISLVLMGDARPGVADLLGFPWTQWYRRSTWVQRTKHAAPFLLRISMGIAMIYLGFYEKLLNPQMSALVVHEYQLENVVPVSAAMWVLSVGIIEVLAGIFLLIGLYTRVNAAVMFFVLTLTFFFFGEDVSSHVTLFGTLSILFVVGADRWSVDARLQKHLYTERV